MRRILILVALMVAAPAVQGEEASTVISFKETAGFTATHVEFDVEWVALFWSQGESADFNITAAPGGEIQERHFREVVRGEVTSVAEPFQLETPSETTSRSLDAQQIAASVRPGPFASLVLFGDEIKISIYETTGGLRAMSATTAVSALTPATIGKTNPYWDHFALGPAAVASASTIGAKGFAIVASGVDGMEWIGFDVSCSAASCPSGGDFKQDVERIGPATVWRESYTYEALAFSEAEVSGAGDLAFALAGGKTIGALLDGEVRFPLASATCSSCKVDEQTLRLVGNMVFADVRPQGETITATLSGHVESARLDETSIDPKLLTGTALVAGGAATLGIIVALKYLLGALFTKLSKEKALQHPRRLVIYNYVKEHPGANFREILRATNIASGTARHHLTILKRSGHLVEHPHGATVRFFENHGKFEKDWSDVVLLRESSLKELYDWLVVHPNVPQKAILQGMATAGWSRSTTQHRLSRLVEGGVVTLRLQGRLKFYAPKTMPTTTATPATAAAVAATGVAA